jgi:hypothetical protein
MPLSTHAQTLYSYLTTQILASSPQATVTYGKIEKATGVPIGPEAGYMGQVLGAIHKGCAAHGLPPLTAIAVQDHGDSDAMKMPGSGYFVELAGIRQNGNPAGWRIDPGIERWLRRPGPRGFDKDTDRWGYQAMIAEHQQSVWSQGQWPPTL